MYPRWDKALGWLVERTSELGCGVALLKAQPMGPNKQGAREFIARVVEDLYTQKTVVAGQLALAWSTLTVDPAKPRTLWPVLPQFRWTLDESELDNDRRRDLRLDDRMNTWWRARECYHRIHG